MIIAAHQNRPEVVKELLRHGARLDAKSNDGLGPLDFAAMSESAAIKELLAAPDEYRVEGIVDITSQYRKMRDELATLKKELQNRRSESAEKSDSTMHLNALLVTEQNKSASLAEENSRLREQLAASDAALAKAVAEANAALQNQTDEANEKLRENAQKAEEDLGKRLEDAKSRFSKQMQAAEDKIRSLESQIGGGNLGMVESPVQSPGAAEEDKS